MAVVHLTFALAYVGYALLGAIAVARRTGRDTPRLRATALVVIAVHVVLVWHVRYGFDPSLAVARGFGGAILFHGALTATAVYVLGGHRHRTLGLLVYASWAVVTLGGVGATFRFDVVEWLRVPMIATAAITAVALARPRLLRL